MIDSELMRTNQRGIEGVAVYLVRAIFGAPRARAENIGIVEISASFLLSPLALVFALQWEGYVNIRQADEHFRRSEK